MTTIKMAVQAFPETSAADWRMIGEATVHESVVPGPDCRFHGPAILRGGTFYGGTFLGGTFYGGTFYGGTFYDGTFLGGTFYGGTFYDGTFHGGTFYGGTFYDGTFYDGTFHGGTFHGGTFYGGTFHGTPLQIIGCLRWPVTAGRPGEVSVGCECHTPVGWREQINTIAANYNVSDEEAMDVLATVSFVESWIAAHPDVVTCAEATA